MSFPTINNGHTGVSGDDPYGHAAKVTFFLFSDAAERGEGTNQEGTKAHQSTERIKLGQCYAPQYWSRAWDGTEKRKHQEMGNVLVRHCRARNGGCRYDRLVEERARGQSALRNLVVSRTLGEVDWEVLIQKAEELHRAEQRRLRKGEKRWKRRQRRKSKALRRRYANDTGVYCINLLSHEGKGSSYCGEDAEFHNHHVIGIFPLESQTSGITSSSDNIRETSSSSSSSSSSAEDDTITPAPALVSATAINPVNGSSSFTDTVDSQQEESTASLESSSTGSTLYLVDSESSQQKDYVTPRAYNGVIHRLEPIDMVDLISKYYTSSDDDDDDDDYYFDDDDDDDYYFDDDDDESTVLNTATQEHIISNLHVHPDVSLTDETDSGDEKYTVEVVNHPELRSAGRGSFPRNVFLKSLAPDGSHQITL